jgi:hypothetical protein
MVSEINGLDFPKAAADAERERTSVAAGAQKEE